MAESRPTAPRSPLSLIELVQARLEAHKTELAVRSVYGVLDFAGARESLQVPCVAAMVIADDFGKNESPDVDAGVVQRDEATVAVISLVSAKNELGGRKGATEDRLTALIRATREVLLGWAPEGAFPGGRWRPLVLSRGRLLSIAQGRAWWQDEYRTHRLIHGGPPPEPDCPVPHTVCVTVNDEGPVPLTAEAA